MHLPSLRGLEDVAAAAATATGAAPASLLQSEAVTFWGVASRLVDEAIELYQTREQAEATLKQILRDEPEWTDIVYVARVELCAGYCEPSAN